MRDTILLDIRHHPLKAQLLVPLHGIAMLFMEEQFAMDLQALAVVFAHSGDNEVESEPVYYARGDQCPSDGRGGEPWGGFPGARGGAAGGGDPGGDDGEEVCDGEEDGGGEADEGVHEGFLAPFAAGGEAEVYEA